MSSQKNKSQRIRKTIYYLIVPMTFIQYVTTKKKRKEYNTRCHPVILKSHIIFHARII